MYLHGLRIVSIIGKLVFPPGEEFCQKVRIVPNRKSYKAELRISKINILKT